MNLKSITIKVAELAEEVGAYIKTQGDKISDTDVEHKGLHDLVTFVDKEAESRIVERLKQILPEAGFIAEENQSLKKEESCNWIIDPLDGTTNFIHGVPVFSVSIALEMSGKIISGVIFEINQEECFYAWKDGGAYLNGREIQVSSTNKIDDSLIATGFPYADYSRLKPYLGLFEELMKASRGIRRLGSAAADLAYLACGRFDVFYEYGLNPWDVAAGIIIVQEAGGMVTDFRIGGDFLFGKEIIASNKQLHADFLNLLSQHFN